MPLDFSKGQIYVIRNMVNDKVYVGSTTQTISRRWAGHMSCLRDKKRKHYKIYRAMEELGVDKFYIEFVEAWPCENKGQLCAREGHYIRKLDSVKNGYNDVVAGRTHTESNAIYHERIRERCQSDNEFRENFQKAKREYMNRYLSDDKVREEINKKRREQYQSNEKFREEYNKKQRERYHRKKAERMQGPAQTDSLELN
jgi:group I intron endonuclease